MKAKQLFLTGLLFLFSSTLFAQLKPSIGINSLPNDGDSICGYPLPVQPDMTFDSYPFFSGDTIPDFTLYGLNGDSINMATRLTNGKPILIVGLNYSCPYVRNHVATYNNIKATYGNLLEIIGIYYSEAHPNDGYSPNSGTYGNVSMNVNSGISVDQHKTYLDRKQAAQDLVNATGLNIPVYLDGPCNEWWTNFGPGPALGYIIKTNGTVFVKHGWFDKIANGHDIYCDIDSLFGSSCIGGTTPNGQFTMTLTTNDSVSGPLGTTIDGEADLINNTNSGVLIEIIRDQNNMDIGWSSALCADICLNTITDSMSFLLPAMSTQHFYMHFYSDSTTAGQSNTKVIFRNVNDFSNQYVQDFYAFTNMAIGLEEKTKNIQSIEIYPQPIKGDNLRLKITLDKEKHYSFTLLNVYGQEIRMLNKDVSLLRGENVLNYDLSGISSGLYFIKIHNEESVSLHKIMKL